MTSPSTSTGIFTPSESESTATPAKAKKGGCGTGCNDSSPSVEIDEKTKERIAKHPCYSEEAHHHYARMHVAVAPACNIQCNYCNRKYF
ncbi:nitrogenase cofactor biosynthesis protein NifB [Calothrix parasitica NIES-267]|uniref:Nitrogenase cofactor biosynthesis protein NifB n=1 Tax=Calothrix parasitica NIES-267 TaxID=1973488 RepID=A0A1Z4LX96_9CYAN|nr:nitrogenase cofactor biosynthesis protein NifB [Calothrix parasitica NIES-267]